MLGWAESEDGGPKRERERENSGSASQAWEELRVVVASVAVTILLAVALVILSLVDPMDDVVMAILPRFISALVSAPRARRVLRT